MCILLLNFKLKFNYFRAKRNKFAELIVLVTGYKTSRSISLLGKG